MSALERAIAAVSPGWALRRSEARMRREMIQASGYDRHGASVTKKSLAGWRTDAGGPDSDIVYNLDKLRERSRDLCMGEGLAIGALKTIRTNEIGAGLRLNSQIDAAYLKLSDEQAQAWEDHVEREFALWAGSKSCDAARRCTFGELQALARLSQLQSGDVFALLPAIPRHGDRFETKVRLVEADVVCNPDVIEAGQNILGGVEVGEYGEPVAYHFLNYHPGDVLQQYLRPAPLRKWTRIPAFGERTGRPMVLHLMESDRPGQRRGVPVLAPVMEALKQLSRYKEAELMAAVVSGFFTAAITSEMPEAKLGQIEVQPKDQVPTQPSDIQLATGLLVSLQPGEKLDSINPARPNAGFEPFVIAVSKQIGAGLGIPYELLVMQFTASYSASRAALLEAWKRFTVGRAWLAASFCQPVYEAWLEEAILRGYIDAPGFFSDPLLRAAWCGAEWIGPTQGQLDPTKEVEAAEMRVTGGYSTRTAETMALTGGDFWKNAKLRAREEQERRDGQLLPAAATAPAAPVKTASPPATAPQAGASAGAQSPIFLAPEAVASIVTVDQALVARGLEPIGGDVGDRWVLEHQHRVDAEAAPDIARRAAAERAKAAETQGAST